MKCVFILLCVFASLKGAGQYYQKRNSQTESKTLPKQITISLSPIVVENGKYYFDGKRVKFEDIVLPLISVNDKIVDHRLKVVNTMTDLIRPIRYIGFAYLTYLAVHLRYVSGGSDTFLNNLIGVYVFQELYIGSISIAKRSTINRYNKVVLQPSASFVPGQGFSLGLSARF